MAGSLQRPDRWPAAEGDDVAVGIRDIEVLRAPGRVCKRLDNRDAVGDALFVKCFDAVDAGRDVKMLVVAPDPCRVLFSLNQLENHELMAAGSDPAKSPVRNRRDTISALR
jgi:hypothetical protein